MVSDPLVSNRRRQAATSYERCRMCVSSVTAGNFDAVCLDFCTLNWLYVPRRVKYKLRPACAYRSHHFLSLAILIIRELRCIRPCLDSKTASSIAASMSTLNLTTVTLPNISLGLNLGIPPVYALTYLNRQLSITRRGAVMFSVVLWLSTRRLIVLTTGSSSWNY